MQELILYAVLALIVGAMLFSVLGKNTGESFDEPLNPKKDPKQALDTAASDKPLAAAPAQKFEGPAAEGLTAIYKADPNFNEGEFLDGAKTAYGMILEAFADGDKETLEGLLNTDVYQTYESAIDDRVAKNLSQTTDLARLMSAEITGASRSGKTGKIDILYTAELATALLDASGEIVSGDLDVLSRVTEVWSYERTLGSQNPNWVLCCVEPHEMDSSSNDGANGDSDGPDHSPDTV